MIDKQLKSAKSAGPDGIAPGIYSSYYTRYGLCFCVSSSTWCFMVAILVAGHIRDLLLFLKKGPRNLCGNYPRIEYDAESCQNL